MQLQSITKGEVEAFREYTQLWREVTAQVEPSWSDREMIILFISTLQYPFYEHMIGNMSFNFVDIIMIGDRVEAGIRNRKIAFGSNMVANMNKCGSNSRKKKEIIVNFKHLNPKNPIKPLCRKVTIGIRRL